MEFLFDYDGFKCFPKILIGFNNVQALINQQRHHFLFQGPQGQTAGESVLLGRAAPHARQTKERDGGEQSGPEQSRLQEEPGRFRPARPRQLTAASLSQTEPLDVGETKENFSAGAAMRAHKQSVCVGFEESCFCDVHVWSDGKVFILM